MTTEKDIEQKFWKALRSHMPVMLGVVGADEGGAQPMTALLDEKDGEADRGPIWFFTSKDADLVQTLGGTSHRAVAHFATRGHDLFASVHGDLTPDNNPEMIDRLWNKFVAAWFEGGKEDPKLQLLRMDLDRAQIWLNGSSLLAGVKLMLGHDPKEDYKDKVAEVRLS